MSYKDRYKRKHFTKLCFSDFEFEHIKAITNNKNIAKNLREILLSTSKHKTIKQIINKQQDQKISYELNKIGLNINQIAKQLNTNPNIFFSAAGEAFIYKLDIVIGDLNKLKRDLRS